MKTVRVAAAVIKDGDKIFATQRGYGEFKDGWEFPGGKIEPGETAPQALVREIKEELDADISVGELICTVEYDYPAFHLSMDCFLCRLTGEKPVLKEHEAAGWLTASEMMSVNWLPPDKGLAEMVRDRYLKK